MGREVRMVPATWKHPKDAKGYYIPLYGYSFSERLSEWEEGNRQWNLGFIREWDRNLKADSWKPKGDIDSPSFEDWDGPKPEAKDYMPDWPSVERTHYQMYEDCTEGTPISPVMKTPEKLAHWLADNGASANGSSTASYEAWLATINIGSAPSMMFSPQTGIVSGVEAMIQIKPKS
jgi:hypothetical protein